MVSWFLLSVVTCVSAQPPLPPEERSTSIGTVVSISLTDGLTLENGLNAPLAPGLLLTGANRIEDIRTGDLVEITRDENDRITSITVLPRLDQRVSLVEAAGGQTPLPRFWWSYEGRDYPDSLYASDLTIPLRLAVLSLEGVVAYLPQDDGDHVEFAILDAQGKLLWSQRVAAGKTAELHCLVREAGSLTLRCRRTDGSTPDYTQCIWGSPTVLLRTPGVLPLPPQIATTLVDTLAASLGHLSPGAIAVTQPRVIGIADDTAYDLAQDLFTALGHKYQVVGILGFQASTEMTDIQRQAATDGGAETVAVSELRYSPQGSRIEVALVHVTAQEVIARAAITITP
ncbi:MAG: hypothetical protein ACUVX8_13555 [Candidatus Zipacnadales bacterium]